MEKIKAFNTYINESVDIHTPREVDTRLCLVFREINPDQNGLAIWDVISPKYYKSDINSLGYNLRYKVFMYQGNFYNAMDLLLEKNKNSGKVFAGGFVPPKNTRLTIWLTVSPLKLAMGAGFSIHFKKWLTNTKFSLGDPVYKDTPETSNYGYYKFYNTEIKIPETGEFYTGEMEQALSIALSNAPFHTTMIAANLRDAIEKNYNITDYCQIPYDLLKNSYNTLNDQDKGILSPYISGKEFNLF